MSTLKVTSIRHETASDDNLVLNSDGSVQVRSLRLATTVTADSLAGSINDWAPGITGVTVIRMSAPSPCNITGLQAGTAGQIVTLINVGTATITLINADASSSEANRFTFPATIALEPKQALALYYDGVSARWRAFFSNHLTYLAAEEGETVKAFFSGGWPGAAFAGAYRTTYGTETTAAVASANLSVARGYPAAAGSTTKGFFAGGYTTTYTNVTDRTTYATETTVAVTGANLTASRQAPAAAGNTDKGFFSGGRTGSTTLTAASDRITYATETRAAVAGAALSSGREYVTGTGNALKGFFSGGLTGGPAVVATADRITYATETTAAVAAANLNTARWGVGAAGNTEKGFFSGGSTSSGFVYSAIANRTTYSTETTAAVSGANLTVARVGLAAAGSVYKGFFSGGFTGAYVATADRTTYATETTAAVAGANIGAVAYHGAAG